jgi:hypothetical protein
MTLDEEKREFYAALGKAITEWGGVEDHLYMVLQNCLRPADHTTIAAVFYAIENFRSKLGAVNAAVAIALAGSVHLAAWDKIATAITRKINRRNALAHHQVLIDPSKPEGQRVILRSAVLNPLSPSVFAAAHGTHLNELRYRRKVFKVLARRIRGFCQQAWP